MVTHATNIARLLIPIPLDCSERFAEGWAIADRAIATGGRLDSKRREAWDEQKQAGYLAREIAVVQAGQGPAS